MLHMPLRMCLTVGGVNVTQSVDLCASVVELMGRSSGARFSCIALEYVGDVYIIYWSMAILCDCFSWNVDFESQLHKRKNTHCKLATETPAGMAIWKRSTVFIITRSFCPWNFVN